jgi:cellulose biosynthesis protein BcsQ
MKVVAVYNMKGGVGKTTAAVNLSYLAASGGQRVLLWDLDPQAAASFAFRIRPQVEGFDKKSLRNGKALGEAIKETDFANLDLLPADFSYRKFDRFLDDLGKPRRVIASLIEAIGRDYDVVLLDCPAGFSLVTEGVLAAADAILVPTVPTILSLRTVVRMMKWAERSDSRAELAAFFSMVDRRKTLHRRACEWSSDHADIFLAGQVPYASVVEQMTVRRLPLATFAAREPATAAFAEIWRELQSHLLVSRTDDQEAPDRWERRRISIESLLARLESTDGRDHASHHLAPVIELRDRDRTREVHTTAATRKIAAASLVHRFDTETRDLQRRGRTLELHERKGSWLLVITTIGSLDVAQPGGQTTAQIDRSWAFDILSGAMSPIAAMERRLGRPGPALLESVGAIVGDRPLVRVESTLGDQAHAESPARGPAESTSLPATIREAV